MDDLFRLMCEGFDLVEGLELMRLLDPQNKRVKQLKRKAVKRWRRRVATFNAPVKIINPKEA